MPTPTPTAVPFFGDVAVSDSLNYLKCIYYVDALAWNRHCTDVGSGAEVWQGFFGWDLITMSLAVILGSSLAAFAISQVLRRFKA